MNMKKRYGLPIDQLNLIDMAINYQSGYGLSDELSDYAFNLSIELNVPLEKAYRYVWEYVYYSFSDNVPSETIISVLDNEDRQRNYFDIDISFNRKEN